ncbi:hypothetical protein Acr_01g0007040 [Actinidia rufa]|uniref:Ubiquitin system component Cue protein n=1 Tax=Actinidia rufa TaxID=165716 RepID=A0A7J0E379_9ERIC|nr:hypothetical protein Acr_01g0007040 [Actinidia rufa]
MSAIVCGKRSSFFEDLPSSPPVAKRIRCSSSSPVRFSPPRPTAGSPSSSQYPFNLSSSSSHFSALDHLSALFPDMDKQLAGVSLLGLWGPLDRRESLEVDEDACHPRFQTLKVVSWDGMWWLRGVAVCPRFSDIGGRIKGQQMVVAKGRCYCDTVLVPRGQGSYGQVTANPNLLERVLQECSDDLDLAIRSLNGLRLGSTQNLGSDASKCDVTLEENVQFQAPGVVNANGEVASTEDPSAPPNLSMGGADWVELFVREMTNASNMDDARARASRALEVLEKSISAHATAEAAQAFHQENIMLKEQVEALIHENALLKRAVTIQHERQKRVNNYALTMHLKQAQQSNSIPGRFHPDVF